MEPWNQKLERFEEIIDSAQDKFADAFWNWQRNY
ncbi:hypothetical protein N824_25685 [Pedobacter sp. V48]|nr:hypothetical protein N824_25685 [Pedobacter sp. V48]